MSIAGEVLSGCESCETAQPGVPAISNPPGLSVIDYRIGTQPQFKARMVTALGQAAELDRLTSRDPADPTLGLVDAWATVLDVLAFYQERIATEGYLRTATETQSVYSLAAEISYVPNPGVAADVMLAFQLETAPGSPAEVPIKTGAREQSLPEPEAKPQTFETVEDVVARPEWNVLHSRRVRPQQLDAQSTSAVLAGTSILLRPGDAIVFVSFRGEQKLIEGGPAYGQWAFRTLDSVKPDIVAGITAVTWSTQLGDDMPEADFEGMSLYAMRTRAGIFGFNAADFRLLSNDAQSNYGAAEGATEWPGLSPYAPGTDTDTIDLDAVYPEVAGAVFVVLIIDDIPNLFLIDSARESARAAYGLSGKTTRLTLKPKGTLTELEPKVRETVVYLHGPKLPLSAIVLTDPVQGDSIELDRVVEGLQPGKKVVVKGKRARAIVTGPPSQLLVGPGMLSLRAGESLQMTAPYACDQSGTCTWQVRAGDGTEGALTGLASALTWTAALDSDESIAELATIKAITFSDSTTTRLKLEHDLGFCYDLASVTINGNVVHATHGESKSEVLGSGDAAQPFQNFALKQRPLTYFSSSAPSGATTTLQVTVDDVKWTEVPTLYGQGPHDQVYVVRIGADGTVAVEFGDGVTGARLPTGVENVKASYRVGIGKLGMVRADRIKLLMTRPFGVQSVDNPLPAGAAADPEQLDSARTNAPQRVVTFDRVVSLTDFEDYARAFAGVAKAQADWVWDGQSRTVIVTVAGTDGAAVDLKSLSDSIASYADPHQRFKVKTYDLQRFAVEAAIILEPGRDSSIVQPAAITALTDAFSFTRRALGQPVFESEVIAVLQATTGVLAVDLKELYPAGVGATLAAALPALRARYVDGDVQPAQLLALSDVSSDVRVTVAT